ncbi:MAG: DUF4349 domain-containing protein [Ilumatobacteraceae bacterium]
MALTMVGCGNSSDSAAESDDARAAATESTAAAAVDSDGAFEVTAGGATDDAAAAQTSPQTPAAGSSASSSGSSATAGRDIVYDAELSLVVEDPARAEQALRDALTEQGGFVAELRQDDFEVNSVTLVVRVPAPGFDGLLAEISALGEIADRSVTASDVTGQVTDLEARLSVARASVIRVQALMDATTALDQVVLLERELSRRIQEVEQLEGQQRQLDDQVSLATITVRLAAVPTEAAALPEPEEQDPTVASAFRAGLGVPVGHRGRRRDRARGGVPVPRRRRSRRRGPLVGDSATKRRSHRPPTAPSATGSGPMKPGVWRHRPGRNGCSCSRYAELGPPGSESFARTGKMEVR